MSHGERARFEVILESIESKIGVLADGHMALNDKFDRLEGKVDQLSDDVAILRADLGSVKRRVEKIERRVEKIEHHVGMNGASKAPAMGPTAGAPARRKPR